MIEAFLMIGQVVRSSFGLYNHVVDVDFQFLVHHIMEKRSHDPLIGCPSILKSEWHDSVAESALGSDEGGLFPVFLIQHDLIVAKKIYP